MYLASALAVGVWAARSSAFLVPLEVSNAVGNAKAELASLLAAAATTVDLDCPGCPFFGVEDTTQVQSGVENKIHLEFGVDASNALTVNKHSIFLHDPSQADTALVVTAPQIRVKDGQQTRPLFLDFAWERLPRVTSEQDPGMTVLPIEFTILALEGHPVKVDTIAINLLQSPVETSIANISRIPFKDTPGATTCSTSSKWSLCRIRAIIAARMQAIMEAAKAHALAAKGWVKGQGKGCRGKFGNKGGPGMRHGHGHGHHHEHGHGSMRSHHYGAHRIGRILHQTLRFFVIPALLGVIGGLVASAIGMLVGQFIAYLWIRFHRNGRRGNARVVEIVIEEDEKDALIVDADTLPQYQDLDVEAIIIEDEKH